MLPEQCLRQAFDRKTHAKEVFSNLGITLRTHQACSVLWNAFFLSVLSHPLMFSSYLTVLVYEASLSSLPPPCLCPSFVIREIENGILRQSKQKCEFLLDRRIAH